MSLTLLLLLGLPTPALTSPQMAVTPVAMSVTNTLGGSTNLILTVSNALTANGNLTFSISTRQTSRSLLQLAAAGVGLPPADHDFTRLAPGKEFIPDHLLVRFASTVQVSQRAQLLNGLGGAQTLREYQLVPGLCLVKLGAAQTAAQALSTFNQTPGILYAEPDYVLRALATIPNDPRFGELWGMNNTGQTGGTPDADIDAPEAWDLNTGSRSVVVAVIDTGVDYTHPDLTNNIWTNPGEISGNGTDDDGNGYVDDVHGYDFVNGNGNPMDDHGHGTHCAGTIGGQGNNGVGVAGVCWQVRIMPVKFIGADGSGSTANAIQAIQYATLMGAQVMNNSWGGGPYQQSLKDAIDAAGAAGIVFVAAAGNDYGNNDDTTRSYPASYNSPNILAVMATDQNDQRSDFSNYGRTNVDLAAPGTSILSCQPGGGYQTMSGTSMAAPHVSGACALLLSANPMLGVAGVIQALLSTVDPVLPGQCVSGGRLNLARALAGVGAAWVAVTPTGATNIVPGAAANLTVTFRAGDLAAGAYSGDLVVIGNDPLNPTATVPVTMTLLPDNLQVSPATAFSSTGARGGPFAPSQMAYTLSNSSLSALSWTVVHAQSWVSLSAAGGTLRAGASLVVTAALTSAANLLAPGRYADTLCFSNPASSAVQRRAVTLAVQPPVPATIYSFSLDTNPGWATQGQWEFGRPLGGGSHNHDPTAGHTGTNVFGYNLAGDYPNGMPTTCFLTTAALDCSRYEQVALTFWRWLGVENAVYDHADIEVSSNGLTWTHVWDHTNTAIVDPAWQQLSYDISAVADRQPTVYIRWGMGPTDGSVTFPGWNLDDISLTGQLTVAAPVATLYSATFDSGNDGFTYRPDPDASSNLWHRTTHRFASPGACQYYGLEGVWNYDTGARNAGNLQSPVISLAAAAAPVTLSFNSFLQTEGGLWDQASVLISSDGGATWATLASPTNANSVPQSAVFTNWTADLSAYVGNNIILRFNFDTIDGMANAFEGWYLDDVTITAQPMPLLLQPVRMNGELCFSLYTIPGRTYVVEYKNTLANGDWIPCRTNTGDGRLLTVTNSIINSSQRFFRFRMP